MSKDTIKLLLFSLLLLTSIPFFVSAFPTGAGTCNVEEMASGDHGPSSLKEQAGYRLSANMPTKGSFEITAVGPGDGFKGILVYVLNAKNERIGEFTNLPPNMQLKSDCKGSTVTHKSKENKKFPFKLNWNAPQGTSGNLTIKSLIVKDFKNWARLDDIEIDPVTGASNVSPDSPANEDTAGQQTESDSFVKKYTLFIVMIVITTLLYIVGSVAEALLKRQQVKSRSFAKTVGGFGNAK
ncbi:10793_t:CDS:1 [Funneliformis geosporum]|uniref:3242_t:CDS:1 n=1 Tax=Funneliformis geosporum TaxID=1117311 RepID=A0A9W4SIG3_9GLOM|nr:10793_t:CDS:1 [Funneliformis geosporum]CAI2170985.1 3242_t:CDS:1 [Funneliformis geosporum]